MEALLMLPARAFVVIAILLVLIRLPFLTQAFTLDDIYYLTAAEYAQTEPLHPHHASYAVTGQMVDMRGHPHPPLNAWILALLIAIFGAVRPTLFHLCYAVFTASALVSVYLLGRRFSPRPLISVVVFAGTPALLIEGNSLMADLPLLAFWLGAVTLFIKAVEVKRPVLLAGAAVLLGAAGLTAYQAVLLAPVLWTYLLLTRCRSWAAWAVTLAPLAVVIGYQAFERATSGELPVAVLMGHFQTYAFQTATNKIKNAAALVTHTGWMLFPAVALAAFGRTGKAVWIAAGLISAAGALYDPHPLFWASLGCGAVILMSIGQFAWRNTPTEIRFPAAWILIFFAGALVIFFAGAARYLLPAAAPLAFLATRLLAHRPRILLAGAAAQLAFSFLLGVSHYQHWDGYREFARELRPLVSGSRIHIDGEWAWRRYVEDYGGKPVLHGTQFEPGDILVTSELAFPIRIASPGFLREPVAKAAITPKPPVRIMGLHTSSGYTSIAFGLRPFDFSTQPADIVAAERLVPRTPTLSYLPMNAPEAEDQIAGGIFGLEQGMWRWTGRTGRVILQNPGRPARLQARFYIPEDSPVQQVEVLVAGTVVASKLQPGPGEHTVESDPIEVGEGPILVSVRVDRTFQPPDDERELGVILHGIGFRIPGTRPE